MSKRVARGRGERSGTNPAGALARLLESPGLARVVPHLAPETLHQLIRFQGLEGAGDLLASMTGAQVASVLDLDLWQRAVPGREEQFDPERFGEWVEALVEAGEGVAVRVVAALDPRLAVAGLSRHVRVFDPSARPTRWSDEDDAMDDDRMPLTGLAIEVGGYAVHATRTDAWEAIVALLLALDADRPDCFHALMRGCRRMSDSGREIDGLDDLLAAPEQLLHDLAVAREQRRSKQGYLTPAAARAFLHMTRQPLGDRFLPNPIAAAHLREDDDGEPPEATSPMGTDAVGKSIKAVVDLLADAGVVPARPRALLQRPPAPDARPAPTRLHVLMAHLCEADARAYLARSRELAFLANALVAGCSVQSRPFTVAEAADAAAATCNLGLEHWPQSWPETGVHTPPAGHSLPPGTFLADHDLVTAFHVGWNVLHETSLAVADRLIAILEDLRCVDLETQLGLIALRRELSRQREMGTPWRARDALDAIATLDVAAWASLLGVLDECPVLPSVLTATLERRTGPVSATAFEFISTRAQVGQVRTFSAALLDILLR